MQMFSVTPENMQSYQLRISVVPKIRFAFSGIGATKKSNSLSDCRLNICRAMNSRRTRSSPLSGDIAISQHFGTLFVRRIGRLV